MKKDDREDYGLAFLLAFDGRIHHLEQGYWIKFDIKQVETVLEKPHGLSYSFTLHDSEGNRLIGFDNAHRAPVRGSKFKNNPMAYDHWHRERHDPGKPYHFTTADQLLADFFSAVRQVLKEKGIAETVIGETSKRRRS